MQAVHIANTADGESPLTETRREDTERGDTAAASLAAATLAHVRVQGHSRRRNGNVDLTMVRLSNTTFARVEMLRHLDSDVTIRFGSPGQGFKSADAREFRLQTDNVLGVHIGTTLIQCSQPDSLRSFLR